MAPFQELSAETQVAVRREVQQDTAKAQALFLGQVEQVTPIQGVLEGGLQVYWVRFRAIHTWKGSLQRQKSVSLRTKGNPMLCYTFLPKKEEFWIVWAKPGVLEIDWRSTLVSSKDWQNATLPEVLENLAVESVGKARFD